MSDNKSIALSEVDIAKLRDVMLARAARAREDVTEFFNFVMRDFTDSNKRIRVMPHQKVGLEFIMAHDRCVNMWPVGTAKTFTMAGLTLYLLGRSPELRGAVISATESQAQKIVQLVRDYIEGSMELRLVFPHLRRGTREGEPWTQTAITVDRPAGIKDASLTAYGVDSPRIIGSRLNWIIIDDVLNAENAATKEQRDKVKHSLDSSILSRLDPVGAKVVFTNTPWHVDDAVTHASKPISDGGRGWATMRMDIYGDIEIFDDDEVHNPLSTRYRRFFDSKHLRPSTPNDPTNACCRLVEHDPDPNNEQPLWPEKYNMEWIERERRGKLPHVFNQLHRCIVRDDASAMCKQEYIDTCLRLARQLGVYSMVSEYTGSNMTFTGVDLAVSPGEENDDTVLFTFEARPGGLNVILDIEIMAGGVDVVDKIFEKWRKYNSVITVENNAAQDFVRQWALKKDLSVPVKGLMTGRTKAHPEHGIPGIFLEMMNGAWAIPNGRHGEKHPAIRRFIDACLFYTPGKHTDDALMAAYMARSQKVKWLGLGGGEQSANEGGIGMSVMSR